MSAIEAAYGNRVRVRTLPGPTYGGKQRRVRLLNGETLVTPVYGPVSFDTLERTVDTNHGYLASQISETNRVLRSLGNRTSVPDLGGEFLNEKIYYEPIATGLGVPPIRVANGYQYSYEGSWLPVTPATLTSAVKSMPDPTYPHLAMWAFGNEARSRVEPTRPDANLPLALGELMREGIPAAVGQQANPFRWNPVKREVRQKDLDKIDRDAFASEYLNYQFGWAPLVSDVLATAKAVKSAARTARQFSRNTGRPIRRRYYFPTVIAPTKTEVLGLDQNCYPASEAALLRAPRGTVQRVRSQSADVWFSGQFTYFNGPTSDQMSLVNYESRANAILGTRITPSTLWNLAPWTWFTDWFVNLGTVLENMESMILDGSVMWYGYIMSHSVVSDVYSHPVASIAIHREVKQRVRALPFGFGLDPNTEFSARQWSILAALGITALK